MVAHQDSMHDLVHSRERVFVIGYYECRLRGWGRVEIVVGGWVGVFVFVCVCSGGGGLH